MVPEHRFRGERKKYAMRPNVRFVFGDNQSLLWNTTVPESTLKKKTSSVAYHFVREGVSCD